MSDTPRTDAFCNQWPNEIEPIMLPAIVKEALVLMAQLERELTEARAQTSDLMQNQTRAMLELQNKWHAALCQRDALAEALLPLINLLVNGSGGDITDRLVAAGKALASVKGEKE
jgi:hypothetical protein